MGFLIILIRPCLKETNWLRQRPITIDKEPCSLMMMIHWCHLSVLMTQFHSQLTIRVLHARRAGQWLSPVYCVVTGPGQAGRSGPPPPPVVLGLVKTWGWRERRLLTSSWPHQHLGPGVLLHVLRLRGKLLRVNLIKMGIIAILCFYCFLMVYSTNQLLISDFLFRVQHAPPTLVLSRF